MPRLRRARGQARVNEYSSAKLCSRCGKPGWVDVNEHSSTHGLCMTCRGLGEPITMTQQIDTSLVQYDNTKTELVVERASAEELLTLVRDMPIESQDDLDLAAEALAKAKGEFKRLEAKKQLVTGPLNKSLVEVRSWFKPTQDFYAAVESILKKKIADYHTVCARLNQLAVEQAAAAHASNNSAGISEALSTIQVPEKVQGLGLRQTWDFEVVDIALVPHEYLFVNETAVRAAMKQNASKDGVPEPISGIRFLEKTIVSSRAK